MTSGSNDNSNKKVEFLTSKDFDYNVLTKNLEKYINLSSQEEQKIVQDIISDFKSKNFSLLSPQVLYFLEHAPTEKWCEYRYLSRRQDSF